MESLGLLLLAVSPVQPVPVVVVVGGGGGGGGGRNKHSRPTKLSHVVTLELQGDKVRDTVEVLRECLVRK